MTKKFTVLDSDPFALFSEWMHEATTAEPNNPNAMALASVNEHGIPSNRMVLLKDYGAEGFTFFTNSQSNKGKDLESNQNVALCLYWKTLQRQVRIVGVAKKTSREITENYFLGRPQGSQIASLCSDQSKHLPDKQIYLDRIAATVARYGDKGEIPCPDHWNGYCVTPTSIEFWQEGEFRTHDRFVFRLADGKHGKHGKHEKQWKVERLYP